MFIDLEFKSDQNGIESRNLQLHFLPITHRSNQTKMGLKAFFSEGFFDEEVKFKSDQNGIERQGGRDRFIDYTG